MKKCIILRALGVIQLSYLQYDMPKLRNYYGRSNHRSTKLGVGVTKEVIGCIYRVRENVVVIVVLPCQRERNLHSRPGGLLVGVVQVGDGQLGFSLFHGLQ